MGFKSEQIQASNTETEKEFMQRIINLICAVDTTRISCSTTAEAQYSDSTATATFDINIDNNYSLRIKRGAVNSSGTNNFWFSIIVDGVEYCKSSAAIRLWSSGTSGSGTGAVGGGYVKVSCYVDNDFIFIWFGTKHNGPVTETFPTQYCTAFVTDEDDECYASGLYNSTDIASQQYYKCSDAGAGYYLIKPLDYVDQAGTISYLANMYVPISSNGNPSKFARGLIASSTRTLGESLFFDGKSYFAIGTNILTEIVSE